MEQIWPKTSACVWQSTSPSPSPVGQTNGVRSYELKNTYVCFTCFLKKQLGVFYRSIETRSTAKETQRRTARWRRSADVIAVNFRYGRHVGSRTARIDYCNATVTGY